MVTIALCMQHYTIPSGLCLVWLYFVFQQKKTPPDCKGFLTKESDASDDVASTITQPQTNWDGLEWVGAQSQGKAANKCSAYVETSSRPLEIIPNEAGWENAKSVQSCHQGKGWLVWRISNIKYILICLTLFWLIHDSICVIS
jgi:hypothetical protein